MNILFFLTPKVNVSYLYDDEILAQALEDMEQHKYSSVPIINKHGKYIGTITEGDLLWGIKNKFDFDFLKAEKSLITSVPRRIDYKAVRVNSNMEDLMDKALNQNFVPVIDDDDNFIGIITRKEIIKYFYKK